MSHLFVASQQAASSKETETNNDTCMFVCVRVSVCAPQVQLGLITDCSSLQSCSQLLSI